MTKSAFTIYHLAPHILQPQLPASLLEFAGPVCDYSNRLVYLLGDYVEKYLLAIRRDIVEEDLAGKVRDDLLRTPELQRVIQLLHGHCENRKVEIGVIEALAILPSQRPITAALRDLPFSLSAAEGYDIHLRLTGLVGGVGEPAPVRRQPPSARV